MKKIMLAVMAFFMFSGFALAAVDLNSATQAQLEALQGIGPTKAKAIVDYRTKNGPFKTVDDLEKVSGIGKATVDKLRPEVTVSGSAAKAATKPATAQTATKTK